MGIRFLCDSCQKKINVKDFLAGKRGVCPHCGEGVRIPTESTLPAKSQKRAETPAATTTQPTPASHPTSVPVGAAVPAGVPVGTAAVPTGSPVPAAAPEPTPAPTVPVGAPVAQAPATPAIPQGAPVGVPVQPTPAPTPQSDPLTEAPDANWYVRPPAGGQYGPAKVDVFRKWLGEGRVTADSLVWRDGWGDWQTAGPLFPELDGGTSTSAAGVPTNGSAINPPSTLVKSSSKSRPLSRRRKKNNSTVAIVIVVFLVLISIALIVTLFAVLANQKRPAETSARYSPQPTTSTISTLGWHPSGPYGNVES